MKILVLSDSHGNVSNMAAAVEQTAPRMIFHLGDCWRDAEKLHDLFPLLFFHVRVFIHCSAPKVVFVDSA